ncbi:hypothetical protein ACIBUY_04035 [Streptomyces sp. NPDC050085]|uniref:hypothetical protein n=1 Tax=Streptomyces sp. NPDC050085 TaxID=3365600 RepID=UPI0037A203BD
MPPSTPATDRWDDAVRRATEATASARSRAGAMDEQCWDDVAMRNIIAIVLYALHLRQGQEIADIRWQAVLWQLRDDRQVATLVSSVLPGAGHDLARTAAPGDPVAECWRWLTQTWDPSAPVKSSFVPAAPAPDGLWGTGVPDVAEFRWGGMTRGIGNALPDPGLEICTPWASHVVQSTMITQAGGHHRLARVEITAPEFHGQRGYVKETGWNFDESSETVDGPAGYVVDLDNIEGTEDFNADEVTACSDLRWPRRPEGSLKDGPPPGLHDLLARCRHVPRT